MFDPGPLAPNTTYYWRVDEGNAAGTTPGPVWQFTTGEWQQYLPTLKKVDAMVRYYAWGIFVNAPHPYHKTADVRMLDFFLQPLDRPFPRAFRGGGRRS